MKPPIAGAVAAHKRKGQLAARKILPFAAKAAKPKPAAPPSLQQMGSGPGGVRTSIQLRDLPPAMQPQLEQMAGLHPTLGPQAPGIVVPGQPAPPAVHVHVHTHVRKGK